MMERNLLENKYVGIITENKFSNSEGSQKFIWFITLQKMTYPKELELISDRNVS